MEASDDAYESDSGIWEAAKSRIATERVDEWLSLVSASSIAASAIAVQEVLMRDVDAEGLSPYLVLVIVLTHMVVGALIGVAFTALLFTVRRFKVARWVETRSDQGKVALGFAFGLVPFVALAALVAIVGLEVRAFSTQMALLPGVLMLTGLSVWILMTRIRASAYAKLAIIGLPALLLGASMPLAPAQTTGASVILEKGFFSRLALDFVRGVHDADADGYPTRLCEHDCDCNDSSDFIHPSAAEITDNGVDEDCDGVDLSSVDYARLGLSGGLSSAVTTVSSEQTLSTEPDSWRRKYNILLIIMDTVRADHLGCHGYERATTPNIDAFAAKSVHFTQARSQGAMTREAMPALLTGKYFSEASRVEQKWPHILPENVMLAEMLKGAGYQTWAMSSFGYFVTHFGYGQGFDEYNDKIAKEGRVHWMKTSHRVTDRTLEAIDRLEERPDDPWFVMAHYADPHSGYLHHKESPRFGYYTPDLYDEEIFYTDLHMGRLFDGVESRGLLEDTIVVITADHGEGLVKSEDHGILYHGQTLYDNLIHVPFIVHAPFAEPHREDRPIALVDVVPTVLDLTGVTTDSKLRGFSLVPYLRSEEGFERPPVFSQKAQPKWKELASVVDWPWKAIWKVRTNRFELYRLDDDPNERRDLSAEEPEQLAVLVNQLKLWRASLDPPEVFQYGRSWLASR